MNLSTEMIPGLTLLLVGAFMGFGAKWLCGKKKNVSQFKLLGVLLAAVGAVMIFIP